jgi:hypothetical protein
MIDNGFVSVSGVILRGCAWPPRKLATLVRKMQNLLQSKSYLLRKSSATLSHGQIQLIGILVTYILRFYCYNEWLNFSFVLTVINVLTAYAVKN